LFPPSINGIVRLQYFVKSHSTFQWLYRLAFDFFIRQSGEIFIFWSLNCLASAVGAELFAPWFLHDSIQIALFQLHFAQQYALRHSRKRFEKSKWHNRNASTACLDFTFVWVSASFFLVQNFFLNQKGGGQGSFCGVGDSFFFFFQAFCIFLLLRFHYFWIARVNNSCFNSTTDGLSRPHWLSSGCMMLRATLKDPHPDRTKEAEAASVIAFLSFGNPSGPWSHWWVTLKWIPSFIRISTASQIKYNLAHQSYWAKA